MWIYVPKMESLEPHDQEHYTYNTDTNNSNDDDNLQMNILHWPLGQIIRKHCT